MNIADIIAEAQKQALDNWGWLVVIGWIFANLVEISPVKIYPVKYIKNKISMYCTNFIQEVLKDSFKTINDNLDKLNQEVVSIKSDLTEYRKEQKIEKIKNLRKEILSFSDDLVNHREFTKRSYEMILFTTYPEYETLIESMEMTNGLVDSSIKFITERYEKHLRDGNFIMDNDN